MPSRMQISLTGTYSPMVVPVLIRTASGEEREIELPFSDGGQVVVPEDCHIISIGTPRPASRSTSPATSTFDLEHPVRDKKLEG